MPAADQLPQGSSRRGLYRLSMFFGPGHAEGKTRVHHQSNFGARVGSGFQVCGPNRKILGGLPLELAGVLAYWSSRPCPWRAFCFWICIFDRPFGPRARNPGLCPDLSRAAGGRARRLQLQDVRPARACMCRGQPLQFGSSLLVRESGCAGIGNGKRQRCRFKGRTTQLARPPL